MSTPLGCFASSASLPIARTSLSAASDVKSKPSPGLAATKISPCDTHHQPAASLPAKIPAPIRQVSPNIYCGPRPSAATLAALQKLGIKTIVNLEDYHTYWGWFGWRTQALVSQARITMVRQPISPLFWVSKSRVHSIIDILGDARRGPFYVHCLFGKERTNLVVALHRRINEAMPIQAARRAMYQDGFRSQLVPLLASQVDVLLQDAPKPAGHLGQHALRSSPRRPVRRNAFG